MAVSRKRLQYILSLVNLVFQLVLQKQLLSRAALSSNVCVHPFVRLP